jgi:hypothetical protein
MALRPLNSIAGFSTGDPAVTIVQANGDITTINFTANGISNVGNIGNFIITGGNNGQFIQTDGAGNLSFATINTSSISNGNSNVDIPIANGNVTVSVNGNSNVAVFTGSGANLVALDVTGISNLGNVGNVKITGGNADQYLRTDGAGNLTWDDVGNISSNRVSTMPYLIPTGESYILNTNFQGLYSQAITIDGELTVDGMLIEIQDSIQSDPTQVLFDTNGTATGNNGFTFLNYNGNLNVPGNINVTGSIIPGADDVYDLGSANKRWRTGYFGGNTIYIGDSVITTSNNQIILESGSGATIAVTGDANTSIIENGTSNITIDLNSDIRFGVGGTANVLILTSNGIDYDGNLVVNGNIIANGGNVTGNVIIGNTANFSGNLTTGGVKTDNLYYANGTAWNFGQDPGGSNTQVQYNNNGNFAASANFTFDSSTNNLTVTGNVVTNTGAFYGNAAGLTNIPGGNITGNITGNISNAQHAVTANTVVNANQPNITSIGTLTTLEVSGNGVIGGNLTVNGNLVYINVEELSIEDPIINLNTGANGAPPAGNSGKDVGSALNYYDTQARIAFMGWDTSNAEFAFGSQTTISSEVVTFNTLGNVRAQTFKGNIEATVIAGNLTTATQSNITTLGTLGSLTVSGNISAGNTNAGNLLNANYLVSNSGCVSVAGALIAYNSGTGAAGIFSTGPTDINFGLGANVIIGSTTGVANIRNNLNVAGNANITGNISANLISGTLSTSAQPNITSVGTLTSLSVSGNITANNYNANTVETNSVISKRNSVSVSTLTVVDSFAANTYRSAKYVISSQSDLGYESLEALLIHNDINSYITVYGAINDGGGNTVTLSTAISSGNVELRATGLSSNTEIRLLGTYIPVI